MNVNGTNSENELQMAELLSTLHRVAFSCSYLSVCCSISVLVMGYVGDNHSKKRFRLRKPIDRLVTYLAIADILFSFCHGTDHLYILLTGVSLDKYICLLFAFLTNVGFFSEVIVSAFVSVAAFCQIVFNIKIIFGIFDAVLLVMGCVLPVIGSTILTFTGTSGFNGVWCGIQNTIAQLVSVIIVVWPALILSIVTYLSIAVKVIQSTARVRQFDGSIRQGSSLTRQILKFIVFILAFFIQWLPLCIFSLYELMKSGSTPYEVTLAVTILPNLGGVMNAFLFTFSRFITQIKLRKIRSVNTRGANSS